MIVTYEAKRTRHVRGTRVEKGDTLYAVHRKNLYFIWSYTDRDMAEYMDQKLAEGPTSNVDRDANWRRDTEDLTPSDTKILFKQPAKE